MTSYDPRGNFGGQKTELTKFDKLAVSICWFGALIIIGVHVIVADRARSLYSPLEGLMPGLTKIVTSPGYAVSMAMLMAVLQCVPLPFIWLQKRRAAQMKGKSK